MSPKFIQISFIHFRLIVTEWCQWTVEDFIKGAGSINKEPDLNFESLPRKSILQQATEAVSFLHSQGMIHRNIKPSNFLIAKVMEGKYLIKLTDLYYCKDVTQNPENSRTWFQWCAPEMTRKGSVLDAKTDIFVLGCFYFYVLSVRDAKCPVELSTNLLTREPELKDAHGADWNNLEQGSPTELIKKMIKEKPEDRPTINQIKEEYFELRRDDSLSMNDQVYDMYDKGTPGLCVIINQIEFKNSQVMSRVSTKGTLFKR